MTTPETARCLALIAATQARVAGMQAANAHRLDCGNSIAYDEDAFNYESAFLEAIAQQVINQ